MVRPSRDAGRPLRGGPRLPRSGRAPGPSVPAPRRGRQPARAPRAPSSGRRRVLRRRPRGRGHGLQLAPAARRAGAWRLAPGPVAPSVPDEPQALRRQWRGYAAGRAWLGRRYEDFEPEPALRRAVRRVLPWRPSAARGGPRPPSARPRAGRGPVSRRDRGAFLALDAVLGLEELAGFALSNRPRGTGRPDGAGRRGAGRRPLPRAVAIRWPTTPAASAGARVEAAARPEAADAGDGRELTRRLPRGRRPRARGWAALVAGRPSPAAGAARPAAGARPASRRWPALAPAVMRLAADRDARVHAAGRRRRRGRRPPAGRAEPAALLEEGRPSDARPVADPPAYTPPYDRALCAALARAGAEVELVTSRFAYGDVPARRRLRGQRALLPARGRRAGVAPAPGDQAGRPTCRTCSPTGVRPHASADVVHFQWLTLPWLDGALLPGPPARAHRA